MSPSTPQPDGAGRYLTLRIGGESFGVDLIDVREILNVPPITVVPNAPACVRGLINLRGNVVMVIDLAQKLGLLPIEPGPRSCIALVQLEHEGELATLGLLTDAVDDILELGSVGLQPAPPFGTRAAAEHVRGMAPRNAGFASVLNLHTLLSLEELRDGGR